MHDPPSVCGRQTATGLYEDIDDLAPGPGLSEPLRQRSSCDELHREEHPPVVRADVINARPQLECTGPCAG
jgi:hypothetical protein